MDKSKNWLLQLYLLLFTLSVSVTVIPSGSVNVQGLFGELKSSMVTESGVVSENLAVKQMKKVQKVKGVNVLNAWFEWMILAICISFITYMIRLPRGDTIVTLKVRMDN